MRLHLIRHGKMAGDPYCRPKPGSVTGCLDPEVGVPQAERLALALAPVPIDLAFASPYGRALQTAEVALAGRGIPIEILDFLHEWLPNPDLRSLSSTEYETMIREQADLHLEESWQTDLGEGTYQILNRVGPPFQQRLKAAGIHRRHGGWVLEDRARDLDIAVFAHGGSLGVLTSFLLGIPPSPGGLFSFELTGWLTLDFSERRGVHYPHVLIRTPAIAASLMPA